MKVTHSFTQVGRCPANGGWDSYLVTVTTDRTVSVEEVLAAARACFLDAGPVFQEAATQALADALGCAVMTQGQHGPVDTCVSCEPARWTTTE